MLVFINSLEVYAQMLDFRQKIQPIKAVEWLHHIYVILAVTAYITAALKWGAAKEVVLTYIFVLYFLVLLIYTLVLTYTHGRKSKYADANRLVHGAIHNARDAYHYIDWCLSPERNNTVFDKVRFREYMVRVLSATAQAFTLTTGTACRASLKVIGNQARYDANTNLYDSMFVQTLARDSISDKQCRNKDRDEDTKHLLFHNTDFRWLFERKVDYYHHKNLPSSDNYENTSLPKGYKSSKDVSDWPLDYRSTIVWPIRYVYEREEIDESANTGTTDQDLYGFLTIDSNARGAFDERFDSQLGASIADALFPILDAYYKIKTKNK